jgi:hypothetical protein
MLERARLGAELLDQKLPDWQQKVNPDTLDMGDPEKCVLGQAMELPPGHFGTALDQLDARGEEDIYGFELTHDERILRRRWLYEGNLQGGQQPPGYPELTQAWRTLLAERA